MARPRGALARVLLDKVHNEEYMEHFDYSSWYKLPPEATEHHICPRYKNKFVNLNGPDAETIKWLNDAREKSSQLWKQLWHSVARLVLSMFLTQTDLNGYLKRGSMFVCSEIQFLELLRAGGFSQKNFQGSPVMIDLLDVGGGDGNVTVRLAKSVIMGGSHIYLKVFCTESSWIMRDRLQERKFTVIESIKDVSNVHLISCLNVLDRCVDPFKILADIHSALAVHGRAIFALVLPYSHYVEKNTSHLPAQPLLAHWPLVNVPFEVEVVEFFRTLEKVGFCIESWTKAPYLCEGDLSQSFYWLTDIVVVVSRAIDKEL